MLFVFFLFFPSGFFFGPDSVFVSGTTTSMVSSPRESMSSYDDDRTKPLACNIFAASLSAFFAFTFCTHLYSSVNAVSVGFVIFFFLLGLLQLAGVPVSPFDDRSEASNCRFCSVIAVNNKSFNSSEDLLAKLLNDLINTRKTVRQGEDEDMQEREREREDSEKRKKRETRRKKENME